MSRLHQGVEEKMTDITESELTHESFCQGVIGSDKNGINLVFVKDGIMQPFPKELEQQILQNQKDAQEYRKIIKMLESLYCGTQFELKEKLLNDPVFWREKIEEILKNHTTQDLPETQKFNELQSQHKKLVDAIQKRIKFIDEHPFSLEVACGEGETCTVTEHIRDELQNLLKESEK